MPPVRRPSSRATWLHIPRAYQRLCRADNAAPPTPDHTLFSYALAAIEKEPDHPGKAGRILAAKLFPDVMQAFAILDGTVPGDQSATGADFSVIRCARLFVRKALPGPKDIPPGTPTTTVNAIKCALVLARKHLMHNVQDPIVTVRHLRGPRNGKKLIRPEHFADIPAPDRDCADLMAFLAAIFAQSCRRNHAHLTVLNSVTPQKIAVWRQLRLPAALALDANTPPSDSFWSFLSDLPEADTTPGGDAVEMLDAIAANFPQQRPEGELPPLDYEPSPDIDGIPEGLPDQASPMPNEPLPDIDDMAADLQAEFPSANPDLAAAHEAHSIACKRVAELQEALECATQRCAEATDNLHAVLAAAAQK